MERDLNRLDQFHFSATSWDPDDKSEIQRSIESIDLKKLADDIKKIVSDGGRGLPREGFAEDRTSGPSPKRTPAR